MLVPAGSSMWKNAETAPSCGSKKKYQMSQLRTHQRICMDSSLKSATLYWMNILGKIDSRTFRTSASLQEWIALHPAT